MGVYIPNLKKIGPAISEIRANKISFEISSFFSSSSLFRTLYKICHKTQMRTPIGLKFGTLEGLIKADLITNFGRNPMNIHGVMTDYVRKIRSKAYRINPLEE